MQELNAAYEGLEASFPDQHAREAYRGAMLARSAPQADFLEDFLAQASVLEVGCGNGRLLIELARRGRLRRGLGIDLARSRIEFARQWAADLQLSSLRFEAEDALALELGEEGYDAVLCITGAFAYFEAVAPGSALLLLRRWHDALRPGGVLVLELYPHPEFVRLLRAADGEVRLWRELEPDDPWRFYLSELRLENGILLHDKTFIHRTTGEIDEGRRERLKLYSELELRAILGDAGFSDVACAEGWSTTPYGGGEAMVVTAHRR
jgi:SAM-dependent methyltransferase